MKYFLNSLATLALLLVACRTGQTQSEPLVITGPVAEATLSPSPTATAQPISSPLATPGKAQERLSYSECYVDGPYIAITFDDGPHATLTPKLLDMLKERNIKATFFMVGQCVAAYPDIVKRMVAEGHEVANHSWNHPALTKLSAEGVRKQMMDTNDAIVKACGVRPVIMRPPYGATNSALDRKLANEYGMKVILWDVDPLDWKYRNSSHVSKEIISNTSSGSIVLAHDIHATTVAAMPETLDALLKKGFKFVTVSELIAMDRPKPVEKKATPSPSSTATPEMEPEWKKSPSASPSPVSP